jgi:hypothetical protein
MSAAPQVASLITALGDGREGLRHFAIRRLVALGVGAVPALIASLKTQNDMLQEAAAIALVTIGEPALPYLLAAMKHEDRKIRWGATWVLSAMPPEIRSLIPEVNLPGAEPAETAAKTHDSGLYGVWSDAWLTKVRERLQAQAMLLGPEPRPAT